MNSYHNGHEPTLNSPLLCYSNIELQPQQLLILNVRRKMKAKLVIARKIEIKIQIKNKFKNKNEDKNVNKNNIKIKLN